MKKAQPFTRISKADFYRGGAFSNPKLYRKALSGGKWAYYERP
jgi:hypothetical protein